MKLRHETSLLSTPFAILSSAELYCIRGAEVPHSSLMSRDGSLVRTRGTPLALRYQHVRYCEEQP